ncbi:hypothetical protein HMI56_003666 [Coelomomyces lativittatus]|nr:hypothetical protein HMI56_003666 [Coelomomyces lativittatus]
MSIESMSTDLYASTSTHHSMTMGGPSSPMPISIDPPSPPSFPSTTTPTPFMPSFSSFPSTPSFPVPSQPPPTSSFSSTSTSSVSPSSTPGVILSEEDRRAFEASEFEFGRIPEIEPPEEFR